MVRGLLLGQDQLIWLLDQHSLSYEFEVTFAASVRLESNDLEMLFKLAFSLKNVLWIPSLATLFQEDPVQKPTLFQGSCNTIPMRICQESSFLTLKSRKMLYWSTLNQGYTVY